jgi:DnaA family protein
MSRGQLPLALKAPRRRAFDNFIAGPNEAVVVTLQTALEPGEWYFLSGPAGSGRTHLLTAAFTRLLGHGSAQFLALAEQDQVGLLEHAAGDWVVLDDVDAAAGDERAEKALFNALNRWRSERSGVLMAGAGRDRFELPDLASRLAQATRLPLKPLEEDDLGRLAVQLAAEHEVVLGRGVIDYILSRAPRNAARVAELVEQAARRALAERRTLSIPLVRELLPTVEGSAQ